MREKALAAIDRALVAHGAQRQALIQEAVLLFDAARALEDVPPMLEQRLAPARRRPKKIPPGH